MTTDSYTFECDLDRNRPEHERAALTVSHDGEHVVCTVSLKGGSHGAEVYLTDNAAADMASIVNALTDTPCAATRARDTGAAIVAAVLFVALIVNPILVWIVR